MKKLKMLMIAGMMAAALTACGGQNGAGTEDTDLSVSAPEAQNEDLGAGGKEDGADGENAAEQGDNRDLDAAAEELLEQAGFTDELNQADAATVEKLYGVSNAKEAVVYISSGATAEEIALFSFETQEEAKQAEELAEARIREQRESFESYVPEEVKKLDNAVILQSGNEVAVCVADGKAAKEILSKYF